MSQLASQPTAKRFGPFEVSPASRELRKHGVRIKLAGQPFDILAILLERGGEVVTREELRQRLWLADTFVDFEHGMNNAVKKLRAALGDSADHPLYIETLTRVGYRFIAPIEQIGSASNEAHVQSGMRWKVIAPAALVVVALASGSYFYFRHPLKLTDKDTIVLADFANTTGDAVFEGTLRQGLSVQLEQSPFLSLVSEPQIQQTLQMMGQNPDVKLTPEIARELCQRTGSSAVLDGSIGQVGTEYLLTVKAVNCVSGKGCATLK
jgi:DNA-binding winged helix-turn-helix (wHTH) protein